MTAQYNTTGQFAKAWGFELEKQDGDMVNVGRYTLTRGSNLRIVIEHGYYDGSVLVYVIDVHGNNRGAELKHDSGVRVALAELDEWLLNEVRVDTGFTLDDVDTRAGLLDMLVQQFDAEEQEPPVMQAPEGVDSSDMFNGTAALYRELLVEQLEEGTELNDFGEVAGDTSGYFDAGWTNAQAREFAEHAEEPVQVLMGRKLEYWGNQFRALSKNAQTLLHMATKPSNGEKRAKAMMGLQVLHEMGDDAFVRRHPVSRLVHMFKLVNEVDDAQTVCDFSRGGKCELRPYYWDSVSVSRKGVRYYLTVDGVQQRMITRRKLQLLVDYDRISLTSKDGFELPITPSWTQENRKVETAGGEQ